MSSLSASRSNLDRPCSQADIRTVDAMERGQVFQRLPEKSSFEYLQTPALLSNGEVGMQGYASCSRQACCFAQYDELTRAFVCLGARLVGRLP
jgi:hypothetical protein